MNVLILVSTQTRMSVKDGANGGGERKGRCRVVQLARNLKFWVELSLLKIPAKLQFQGRASRDSGDYDAVASIVWRVVKCMVGRGSIFLANDIRLSRFQGTGIQYLDLSSQEKHCNPYPIGKTSHLTN
jgi:hypothetical protein